MEIGTVTTSVILPEKRNQPAVYEKRGQGAENVTSVSVVFERTEVTIDYTLYTRAGTPENNAHVQPETAVEQQDIADIARLREAIHAEVLAQVKYYLGTFFTENPEAVEQVSRGEIPEYFNVENTARRILDIYFAYFEEGQDRTAFVERAKSIIEQAYGDVAELVGELPAIVLQTRDKVMEILDIFADGGDVSEFMQRKIG